MSKNDCPLYPCNDNSCISYEVCMKEHCMFCDEDKDRIEMFDESQCLECRKLELECWITFHRFKLLVN